MILNLCYMNQHGDILHWTPLKEVFNLRWYIQHLMDQSEDEAENRLSEENWMKQTNWKLIKYVIHHKHENLDTEEGESNEDEEETSTSSNIPEQDSESDTSTEDEEESNTTETLQVHHGMNETTHDEENSSEAEDDTLEDENGAEMQTYENNGEQNNEQEDKLLTTNFEVKVENQKVEGLISYSIDQQIFKFKVNSGTEGAFPTSAQIKVLSQN